jgi:ABC-type multidrug transport system ATPase subunit
VSEPILAVRQLCKAYSSTRSVLSELELELAPGAILCVTGANGAGKTTLLRCIAGLVLPDAGSISIGKEPAGSVRARGMVGFASGDERWLSLPLSIRANLVFFGRLYGLNKAGCSERIRELGEALGVVDLMERPVHECSAGARALAGLARATLHRPALLLLDEPDRSLDREHRSRMHELLQRHAESGGAVLMVTHDDREIAALSADSRMLAQGRLSESPPP